MNSARKILVVRGGALGDFILTLPVLAALRRNFPNSALEILGYERVASLAVAGGLADRVSALESPALAEAFARDGVLPANEAEYFAKFDLIISYVYDPDAIFQSNVSRCTGARFLIGPHRPDESTGLHAAKALLRPLAVLGVGDSDFCPRLVLPSPAKPAARELLAVHPGSGSAQKNWPEPKWLELLKRLASATEWNFLLIGGEAEGGRCERLAAALAAHRTHLAQNLPLLDLAQGMRSCFAFIGHDSGITHLAAALDLPGLVLWGPSNEAVWRPMSASNPLRLLRDDHGLEALPVETVFQETRHVGLLSTAKMQKRP
jgi:heptosyltransferase-3